MKVNGYKIKPGANLEGADLRDANLSDANLSGANLISADLRGAKLTGAIMDKDTSLLYAYMPDGSRISIANYSL